jgi:O-acetyl-ADP-ribose deacetylase (regulator of RNase III)
MPFQIIRNDITKVKADAIVNTANPKPRIGRGTDSAIYAAAGETDLLAERKKIGVIAPGKAVSTSAFALNAKYGYSGAAEPPVRRELSHLTGAS